MFDKYAKFCLAAGLSPGAGLVAYTKLRTPAEPESGPGNAAVKFHGTLSKKRITWCSPGLPSACLPGKTLSKLSNAAGAKTLYKIQFGFLERT